MATPFSTPRYPGAPHPTPRSTAKIPPAPIHNPYDKFTQPQFDAWIGDITAALKHALGRDDAPVVSSARPHDRVDASVDDDGDEDVMEDSFAEVKARRLAKGKQRARDEDLEQEEQEYGDQALSDGMEAGSAEESYSDSDEESEDSAVPQQHNAEVIDLLSDDGEEYYQQGYTSGEEAVAGPAPADPDTDEEAYGSGLSSNDDRQSPRAAEEDDEDDEDGVQTHHRDEDDGDDDDVLARRDVEYDEDESVETDSEEDDDRDPRSNPTPANHEVTEILDSGEEEDELQSSDRPSIPARFLRKVALRHHRADEEHAVGNVGRMEDADAEVDAEEDPDGECPLYTLALRCTSRLLLVCVCTLDMWTLVSLTNLISVDPLREDAERSLSRCCFSAGRGRTR